MTYPPPQYSRIAAAVASIARQLPFGPQQALTLSIDGIAKYDEEHAVPSTGLDYQSAALLAAARLDYVLQATRPELSDTFDEGEINTLLDCYQGDNFFPDQFDSMDSDLCDHWGIEIDDFEDEGSDIAELVSKLRSLSRVQRVVLADALEQAWHRGIKNETTPAEIFAGLGINLL